MRTKLKAGRRKLLPEVRLAQTAASSAVARMVQLGGRQSIKRQLGNRDDERRDLPAAVVDSACWLDQELELLTGLGVGVKNGKFNGSSFSNYLAGRKLASLGKVNDAIQVLVRRGMLPTTALLVVPESVGAARALVPFRETLDLIKQNGELHRRPSDQVLERLGRDVALHAAGQSDIDRLVSEDRTSFIRERTAALSALHQLLHTHLMAPGSTADERRTAREALDSSLSAFLQAVRSLRVLALCLPQRERKVTSFAWVADLMAPLSPDGNPAFGPLFSWLLRANTNTRVSEAVESLRVRVLTRWNEDILQDDDVEKNSASQDHSWSMATRYFNCDRPRPRDEATYLRLSFGLGDRERCFLRRASQRLGPAGLRLVILLRLAESWYFGDEAHESVESDFENRIESLLDWARQKCTRSPEQSQLRRLVREMDRLTVRIHVELNADIAEPVELLQQWWRCPSAKDGEWRGTP